MGLVDFCHKNNVKMINTFIKNKETKQNTRIHPGINKSHLLDMLIAENQVDCLI